MNKSRELGYGTFISLGCPAVTEIVDTLGFDWMLLDMEHGMVTIANLMDNLRAIYNTKAVVRVDEPSHSVIGHVLDYGAVGIMVPHIGCAEEARKALDAMHYPPIGSRGLSTSTRCFGYGRKTLDNRPAPLLLAQIEDYDAVLKADEIAAVDGVDILFVGPRDLSHDLSIRSTDSTMTLDEALQKVAAAARRYDKQAGTLVRNLGDLEKLRSYGYSCLAIGSDMGSLKNGYKDIQVLLNL